MSNNRLYADNAKTTLASPVFPADTTITVTDGSLFPNPVDGDFFAVTIDAGSNSREIIHVFGRSLNTFTQCVRGQEGSVAGGFAAGTRIENRATSQTYRDFARLVDRLGDIDSVDSLPNPLNSFGNSYLTRSTDDSGTPVIAVKNGTKWSFLTHPFLTTSASVTSDSGPNSLTSQGIAEALTDFKTGKYIVQFLTGPNAGQSRMITSLAQDEISWAGATLPNLYGVDFEIFQSSVSAIEKAAESGGVGTHDEVQKPVNITPEEGASTTGISPTFLASTFRSLYGYAHLSSHFQVGYDATFSQIVADSGEIAATLSWTPSTFLDQNNAYFWRVRYQDSAGVWSKFSDPTSFSTGNVVISVPRITAPTAGAVGVPVNTTLRSSAFSVVGGADTHLSTDWELWTGPNGTGTLVFSSEDDTVNLTSIAVTGLTSLTSYYARVRYKGVLYGFSSWSGSVQFSTSGFIVAPSITSPTEGQTDLTESFEITSSAFSVNGSTDTHSRTDWQIWTGANGTGTKVWESMGATGNNRTRITIPPNFLQEDSTYYIRVRYQGQTLAASDWSTSRMFQTKTIFFQGGAGEEYEGGYYGGAWYHNGSWKALIVAGAAAESEASLSPTSTLNPNITHNGYSDWKAPLEDHAYVLYRNLKPTVQSNAHTGSDWLLGSDSLSPSQTGVPNFSSIGSDKFLHGNAGEASKGYFYTDENFLAKGFIDFAEGRRVTLPSGNTLRKIRPVRYVDHPPGVFQPRITSMSGRMVSGELRTLLTSTDFQGVAPSLGGHVSSDWQIWSGPNGTGSLLFQSLGSTTNKTELPNIAGSLTLGTTYYPRVRYHAGNGMVSQWSMGIPFVNVPSEIGTPFGGGFYFGRYVDEGVTYGLVISPRSGGSFGTNVPSVNATLLSYIPIHLLNGKAATDILANSGIGPFVWARSLTLGGFSDWYVPSVKEAVILFNNLRPTSNALSGRTLDRTVRESEPVILHSYFSDSSYPAQTSALPFRTGGSETFDTALYDHMLCSTGDGALFLRSMVNKTGLFAYVTSGVVHVRAIRRVRLNP